MRSRYRLVKATMYFDLSYAYDKLVFGALSIQILIFK
jgi:hypothetical protein